MVFPRGCAGDRLSVFRDLASASTFSDPFENVFEHLIAIGACKRPYLAIGAALHVFDQTFATLRDRRDHGGIGFENSADEAHEASREALHLPDLVDEVELDLA